MLENKDIISTFHVNSALERRKQEWKFSSFLSIQSCQGLVCFSIVLSLIFGWPFTILKIAFFLWSVWWSSQVAQRVKNLPAMQEMQVRYLGWEDPLEKEMATHSSIRPGESNGQRSLVGYSPWGHTSRTRLSDFILLLLSQGGRDASAVIIQRDIENFLLKSRNWQCTF